MSTNLDLGRRAKTYALLGLGRSLLSDVRHKDTKVYQKKDGTTDGKKERTAHCYLTPTGKNAFVEYDYENNKARYNGLQTCSSVWACPYHSWQISRGRRDELVKVSAVMEEDYYVLFLTFTVAHTRYHFLLDIVQALSSAFNKFRGGRDWKEFRERTGYSFDVQSFEVTYGFANGWHPHKHWLAYFLKEVVDQLTYFTAQGETLYGVEALVEIVQDFCSNRWTTTLENDDYGFTASLDRGVTVKQGQQDIVEYISKFGYIPGKWRLEDDIVMGSVKKGRSIESSKRYTPFQLLEENLLHGSDWASERWLEYVFTMKRRHQLRYMRGFKPFLADLGVEILTDEQLAQESDDIPYWAVLSTFSPNQWRQIITGGLQPLLLDYIESVQGDINLINKFLMDSGVNMTASV